MRQQLYVNFVLIACHLSVSALLSKAGRAIKRIVPDGNCFFRAVAFYLFQDESKHYFVRAQIVEFERVNEKQFTKFLISPVNKPTFEGHLEYLQQPMSWATQVEVIALATFFKVPVYNFTNNNGYFHWLSNPSKSWSW